MAAAVTHGIVYASRYCDQKGRLNVAIHQNVTYEFII